ncbi:hypothetical protein BCR39DRAFT_535329 [Naematelia encephala]|uniref:CCHC-type domain-containing protein n=1 Tax=Naematelia encephala TaxID=71784 RepID=A0A1Y2B153_9TREE|nr:hypothetical protein BCR39DRAFT_535329 [Naematelia encephala]
MARFTSIGMKRKSFVASAAEETRGSEAGPSTFSPPTTGGDDGEVKKKKTHRAGRRNRPKQAEVTGETGAGHGREGEVKASSSNVKKDPEVKKDVKVKMKKDRGREREGWGRDPIIAQRANLNAAHADALRAKRVDQRYASTTCFACRAVGHAAKDCPNVLLASRGQGGEDLGEESNVGMKRKRGKQGGEVTGGKCYRCNSIDHSLSQCPEPIDASDPTPFATCFICLGTGHLSSLCPANKERGIYVNGGSCKICGSVAHRAKDCPSLPQKEQREERDRGKGRREVVLGDGTGAGADEDDFMVQARQAGGEQEQRGGKRKKHAPARNGERGVKKGVEDGGYAGSEQVTGIDQVEEVIKPVVKVKPKVISF